MIKLEIDRIIIVVLITVFFNVTLTFADMISIYCPYCDNIGVEVLNDKGGVCKCFNCNRNMLILNGTIYTDDKRELPLFSYVVYPEKSGNALNVGANENDSVATKINIESSYSIKNSIVESEDDTNYGVEPEADETTKKNEGYISNLYTEQVSETLVEVVSSVATTFETFKLENEIIDEVATSIPDFSGVIDATIFNNITTQSEINLSTRSIIADETLKNIDEFEQDKLDSEKKNNTIYVLIILMVFMKLAYVFIKRKSRMKKGNKKSYKIDNI